MSKECHKVLYSRDPSTVQDHERSLGCQVEFLYPPLEEGWSQPSGHPPISKPMTHSPPATAIHVAVLPVAFILSSSLPWLPKPSLTQHTKLKDKQRQGHTEGEENSSSQPTQHGVYRQRRGSRAVPPWPWGRGDEKKVTQKGRADRKGGGVSRERTCRGRGQALGERPSLQL